jgi:hypothetical protein
MHRDAREFAIRSDTLGGMCRRTTCKSCGKPNWAGCGAHVEQVLGDVPKSERCRCRETKAAPRPTATSAKDAAPAEETSAFGRFKTWLQQ